MKNKTCFSVKIVGFPRQKTCGTTNLRSSGVFRWCSISKLLSPGASALLLFLPKMARRSFTKCLFLKNGGFSEI